MAKGSLQTLERGVMVLEIVAKASRGVSLMDIAEALDIHRTIAYRLVSTLESLGLVVRPGDNRIYLGSGVLKFANSYLPQIRNLAQPILLELANETNTTAFISVAQGDECSVISTAQSEKPGLHVSYKVGTCHPLDRGAAGLAILANRPEAHGDNESIKQARDKGYSLTQGQIEPGASGLACALQINDLEASIGVVTMGKLNIQNAAEAVMQKSKKLAKLLNCNI